MIRALVFASVAAFALTACGREAAAPDAPKTEAKAEAAAPAVLEARVNMAPIDPAKAKPLMHLRHEKMEVIRDQVKAIRRQLDAGTPDMAKVAASAATIDTLAKQAGNWFPAGTGPDVGKTMAKPEIWQKPQDFAAKMTDFQAKATAFSAAARSGDVAATKAAFGTLAKTCKTCHDPYRKEH